MNAHLTYRENTDAGAISVDVTPTRVTLALPGTRRRAPMPPTDLTPAQARRLAHALLFSARAVEANT